MRLPELGSLRHSRFALFASVSALAIAGCSDNGIETVSPEMMDMIVSPYSDSDTFNYIGQPKTDIQYRKDGTRTYTVEDDGPQRVKEDCNGDTLRTILPYKGVFKLYWGQAYENPACTDDGKLTQSDFPEGQ